MSLLRVASVGLLVFGSSACIIGEDIEGNVEQQVPVLPPGGCDEFGCGTNSPEIDHLGIHDIFGMPTSPPTVNANGFYVTKLQWQMLCGGTTPCGPIKPQKEVWVEGGVMKMSDGATTSTAVVGLSIFIQGPGGKYEVMVQGQGRPSYWAHATGGEIATSYLLNWDAQVSGGQKREWKAICTNPPNDGSPELLGMDRFQSVVFEGDNIDAHAKTIKPRVFPGEKNWFNIGCAGHALAKLHLTGHTYGSNVKYPAFHTDVRDRQTTLKMIVGDYCGRGFPFTVAGQPLQWTDAPAFNVYLPGFMGKKEAEWTEKGASCLNTPRVLANPTPTGAAMFPTLLDDIKAECGGLPPACADVDPYTLNGAHIISSNP